MTYKEILENNSVKFIKTCHCNGFYTEVFETHSQIQVRVNPRNTNKSIIIKQYGRVIYTPPFHDLTLFNELLTKLIQEN